MASWQVFRESLLRLAAMPRERRGQILFRGQSNASWPLVTTLDRFKLFTDDAVRSAHVRALLSEFRRESLMIRDERSPLPEDDALELLGRHHGLPSPLMDWSQSPYVAAYFAYQDAAGADPPCVWIFDRAALPAVAASSNDVDIVDDRMLLQFNRRALHQQGVFLRVNTVRLPLIDLLGPALFKIELDAADRTTAMADLDAMNINATVLFDDFDGVARTVRARLP